MDFSKVAKMFSECDSRANGGNLGYLEPGSTSKAFEEAVFALQQDEMSDIVETDAGLHILLRTDKPGDDSIHNDPKRN